MHYLTTPFSLNFSANTKPSYSKQVNGMSTKTNAVKHALQCDVFSNIDDLENASSDLLVEPLFFKSHSHIEGDTISFEERLTAIREYKGRKILLCSEMTPLRWDGEKKEKIVSEMDFVLASCEYQANLLEAIGINVDKVVYEPVNEHLYYPGYEKKNWVVAVGSPTHVKNADAIIEIFEGLADTPDLTKIFIGSPIVWGNITFMKRERNFVKTQENLEKIKQVCDVYHTASSPTFVAYMLSQAKYYLNFAYHETCCRTAMEALLSGTGILAGKHPLFSEYPCVAAGLTAGECVETLKASPEIDSESLRDWALENVSYSAFSKKVKEITK